MRHKYGRDEIMFRLGERERKSKRERERVWEEGWGAGTAGDCSVAHNQLDYLMLSVRAALRIAHADKQTESADADAETTENRSRSHHERDAATVRVSVPETG